MRRNKSHTKRRILHAACELLEHAGMNGVSVRQVAKKVKVTPMAIYNHFPSLEALLAAVYEVGVNKLARRLWRTLVRAETPEQKLRALVRSYARFGIENPHYYTLLFGSEFIQRYLWDRPPRSLVMENFWLPFTEVIEACQENGLVDPAANPQEIATYVWSTMHGYVSFLIIGRLQQLWQMESGQVVEMMERHLLAFLKS